MADDSTEKSEQPTPERLRKAREDGQYAQARDATGVAASLAVLLAMAGMGKAAALQLQDFATTCFQHPFDVVRGDPSAVFQRTAATLGAFVVPAATGAAAAALAIGFAQAGFHPEPGLLMPNFSRLNPMGKLKQMFSPGHALTELAGSGARVLVLAYIAYWTLKESMPVVIRSARADVLSASSEVASALTRLVMRACGALVVLAAADYALSKYRLLKRLMMSRQEIKEEMRSAEGDPRVKARQRAIARARLKKGLTKQVKTADVVVANPTHISVCLRYRPEEGAPVLAAKGYDDIALHIREIAKENNIPVIENKPLARAIAARVRVGKSIPVDLFAAVAELLAFVYRMKRRRVG